MAGAFHVCSDVLRTVVGWHGAGTKIRSMKAFRSFSAGLTSFGWLPARLRSATAIAVVSTEVATGLLAWAAPMLGASLALALLLVFTAATLQAGRAGNCQCFGD